MDFRPAYILIGCLFVFTVSCGQDNVKSQSSSASVYSLPEKLSEKLGETAKMTMQSGSQIRFFTMEPKLNSDPAGPAGFAIRKSLGKLDNTSTDQLFRVLCDEITYDFKTAKKCPFIAEYGFLFEYGTNQVWLLIAPSCDMLEFIVGDVRVIEDYDGKDASRDDMRRLVFGLTNTGGAK